MAKSSPDLTIPKLKRMIDEAKPMIYTVGGPARGPMIRQCQSLSFPAGTLTNNGSGDVAVSFASMGGGTMDDFVIRDSNLTAVTIGNQNYINLTTGYTNGMTAIWTDTSTGSSGDPFDLDLKVAPQYADAGTVASGDFILIADIDDSNKLKKVTAQSIAELGSGIISISGTPVNNQLTVWTDSNTVEGDENLTWTGSEFLVTGSVGINMGTERVTHGLTLPNTTANNDGTVKATAYLTYSSRRFKTNIEPIQEPLAKLNEMRGVTFNWRGSGKKDIGFIVEEVEKVLPEVIGYDGENASSMDYAKMTSFLLQCVKEQQAQIHLQATEINQLKKILLKK